MLVALFLANVSEHVSVIILVTFNAQIDRPWFSVVKYCRSLQESCSGRLCENITRREFVTGTLKLYIGTNVGIANPIASPTTKCRF